MQKTEENSRNGLAKALKWFLRRVGVFYCLLILAVSLFVDFDTVRRKAGLIALNRVRPTNYQYLFELSEDPAKYDKNKIRPYVIYYKRVADYIPKGAGAFGILGFCYFYKGDISKSIEYLQKSVDLFADFFWTNYNLGLAHFRQKNYPEAIEAMQRTIKLKLSPTIDYIKSSKIYLPIIHDSLKYLDEQIIARMKTKYSNGYAIIILSYSRLQDYKHVYYYAVYGTRQNFPNKAFFNYYAGMASYHLKRYGDAIMFLGKSIEQNPYYKDSYHYLAKSLELTGREPEAQKIFELENQFDMSQQVDLIDVDKILPQIY